MTTVISVEQLSKTYRLGQIGTGTFSRDLDLWWAKLRGKPNPLLKIGQVDHGIQVDEELWALKDVCFTVGQGEVLGIIGRNGAGKSTLLKILSRVTAPTSGLVKVKGRIASLLEVGTGFHPELTGRENIFLNGAILGMSKQEVTRKFNEIVDFSDVEKFIETPVKRYSSGMYVRLAFAVAAHLDPEILVVDEVLAVGDAEFQKKCLGKMGDVAKEGRTVLFVSHNMQAVQNLCNYAIVLNQGVLDFSGPTDVSISHYLKTAQKTKIYVDWGKNEAPGNNNIRLLKAWVNNQQGNDRETIFTVEDDLDISVEFENMMPGDSMLGLTIHLQDERNILVFVTGSGRNVTKLISPGMYRATCRIPGNLLHQGSYTINRLLFVKNRGRIVYEHANPITFDVVMPFEGNFGWMGKKEGVVHPNLNWSLEKIR